MTGKESLNLKTILNWKFHSISIHIGFNILDLTSLNGDTSRLFYNNCLPLCIVLYCPD